MPTSVTNAVSRRPYHSPKRREQAERTERRIVDAAGALLATAGWEGTTMASVAKEAGISPAMLYKVFRTKAELVKRAYDVALVGDQAHVPFRERPEFQAVLNEPDPHAKVAGYAYLIRLVIERILPLYEQIRAASTAGDHELASIVTTAEGERLFGARGIVTDFVATGALRPGLDEDEVVDLVWMAMSPEFWSLLRTGRGWSWDRTEAWVAEHLRCTLL